VSRRALVVLELVTGAAGLAGGVLLAAAPDGLLLRADPAVLAGTPFSDWRVPGVLLAGLVGGGFLLAGWWQWRGYRHARELSVIAGAGLVGFEAAELAWIGSQPLEAAFAAAGVIVVSLAWRTPRAFSWGATRDEAERLMAGDDLCPRPQLNATRAVTIAAAPEDIWPWLVQWGWNRAGFYSYDLLDNLGRPSARQILPQFQHLAVGDWVPMGGKTTPCTAYRVTRLEPGKLMLWQKVGGTWLWLLEPAGPEHTRLSRGCAAATSGPSRPS